MKKNNKKGFTLVELVIVIAVIAVLSAILVPTFGKVISDANENARREDARIAYQNFIIEHSEDDVNDVLANKAYILINVKPTEDDKLDSAQSEKVYIYVIDKGNIDIAKNGDTDIDIAGFINLIGKSESESSGKTIKVEAVTKTFEAQTAYSLGKAGMYIVFAA